MEYPLSLPPESQDFARNVSICSTPSPDLSEKCRETGETGITSVEAGP